MKTVLIFLLLTVSAWAEDVVQFDSVTGVYQGCRTLGDSTVWLTDPNDITTPKPGFLYVPDGCASVVPGVHAKYLKVESGVVVEMTKPEKDAVDQPAKDAQDARAALVSSLDSKLKGLGFTDAEIALLQDR